VFTLLVSEASSLEQETKKIKTNRNVIIFFILYIFLKNGR
jgi:hypothetical protein